MISMALIEANDGSGNTKSVGGLYTAAAPIEGRSGAKAGPAAVTQRYAGIAQNASVATSFATASAAAFSRRSPFSAVAARGSPIAP